MATYTEPVRPLEFLVSEGNGQISRDQIVVVSGAGVLKAGTVLGKITSGGKFRTYDNSAATGIEVAAGVLAYDVDASAADQPAVMIARLAEVKAGALSWGTNDGTGITAGTADLQAKLIFTRAD